MPRKTPSYRKRKDSDQAIVTLSDSATGKRKDYWLGLHGTPESREAYHRVIAQWEANDRRWPERFDSMAISDEIASGITITEVIHQYWRWAKSYYTQSEAATIASALRLLRLLFGTTPAASFGPNRLRLVREEMIRGNSDDDPPRRPWSRKHINGQVHRICAMFKWAASYELLPASVYQQLKTIPSLKRGRTNARETESVRPVPVEIVESTRPFLSRQVRSLVDLQLYTGARGGELFKLRAVDITMDDREGIWKILPRDHKTAHHGHNRAIYLGPKAQVVIRPFLVNRAVDAYLFSPIEAEAERLADRHAERTTPISCGNRPGTNRSTAPKRGPGKYYTAASYRRAIERATEKAFPPPEHLQPRILENGKRESRQAFFARLTSEEHQQLRAWRRDHRWHPHQLRHAAATLIRREFGLEAARVVLGHSSALVTDAVYAERDMASAIKVVQKLG